MVLGWATITGVLLLDRLFLMMDLIINKGLSLVVVGDILGSSLPYILVSTAPLAMMTGAVIGFGRLAHDQELLAIQVAGVNPVKSFRPLLYFGIGFAALMVGFGGWLVPTTNHRLRNLMLDISRKRPAVRIEEGIFMDGFPGYTIFIGAKDERRSRVSNVTVYERRGGSVPSIITAPIGEISTTPDERYLILTLFDGEIHEYLGEKYRHLEFGRHTLNLPLNPELVRRERKHRSDRELTLSGLWHRLQELDQELVRYRTQLSGPGADPADRVRSRELESRLRHTVRLRNRYLVEVHKKFALPVGGLILLCLGAPLGVRLRRGGFGPGFLASLLCFAIYYGLALGGEELADSGSLSGAWAMWLPNLILVLPATDLFLRVFQGRSLLWR